MLDLIVQATGDVSPEFGVNGEVGGILHLQHTPIAIGDVAIITLSSFFSPVIDGKEQGVSIRKDGHIQEPKREDMIPAMNVRRHQHGPGQPVKLNKDLGPE